MQNNLYGSRAKAGPSANAYDIPAPSQLLDQCPRRDEHEFTHLRYSSVNCDPDFFHTDGFTLRQALYYPPRQTELLIAVTMYNEDDEFLCRTLQGVMENIARLCEREKGEKKSRFWGENGWKKVVVCVIADGRNVVHARALAALSAMGIYQDDAPKFGEGVTAHVFEYTTQVCMTPSLEMLGSKEGVVPVQFIFCLKEKNQKKINSHRWFFNAFAPILQPTVCVLVDVGTQPGPDSVFHLWNAFRLNEHLGGACGELVVLKNGKKLLNPLVAAQNFEYKISNILDKPFESVMGYIPVLPGAFSAYRYAAVRDDVHGEGPLEKYFAGERKTRGGGTAAYTDIFTANMFLAEDRILGWELVSRPKAAWVLRYVKSAWAVTDVPEQVPELLSQRRRWLNGAFFVALHSTAHFSQLWKTSHGVFRKIGLHLGILYQAYNLLFSWFGLAHYYIAFVLLTGSLEDPSLGLAGIQYFNHVLTDVFVLLLAVCFVASLGTRPQGSQWMYTSAIIGYAVITLYLAVIAMFLTVRAVEHAVAELTSQTSRHPSMAAVFANATFRNFVLSMPGTYAIYVLASLVFLDPWHMITSVLQAVLFAPSNITVLNLYAFANMHDVSWGTKGDNKAQTCVFDVSTTNTNTNTTPKIERGSICEFRYDVKTTTDSPKRNANRGHLTLDMNNLRKSVEIEIKQVNENEVEIALVKNARVGYDSAIRLLAARRLEEKESEMEVVSVKDRATAHEDYYRAFRTNLLLAWGFSNAAVVVSILWFDNRSGSSSVINIYLSVLLYSMSGQAFVRFLGTLTYQILRLCTGE